MNKVLVISANASEEAFGCLGTLLQYKEKRATFEFLAFTENNTSIGYQQMGAYFNARPTIAGFSYRRLNSSALLDLLAPIETILNTFRPDTVYCPFLGDLDVDHKLIAEASAIACHPRFPNAPKEVWMYYLRESTDLWHRKLIKDWVNPINAPLKQQLITSWYPQELRNGREVIGEEEYFERWPR